VLLRILSPWPSGPSTARSKLLISALTFVLAASASAQCLNPADDFDGIATGVAIDTLPGWSDEAVGSSVFTATNVDNGTTEIVVGGGGVSARRRINNFLLQDRFVVASDVTVYNDSFFGLVCRPIIQAGNVTPNFRTNIRF
jgi:opacity protein-like surface antigen